MEISKKNNPKVIDKQDVLFLFIDHQAGFLQTVESTQPEQLRNRLAALAKTAELNKLPVVYTGIDTEGSSGPVLPEIGRLAPNATFVSRKFEINAWENETFHRAVKKTGKKTLILSGIWTGVCVTFPCLCALQEGYEVYVVTDACGDISEEAHRNAVERMTTAGAIPVAANAVIAEIQRSWAGDNAPKYREIYAELIPRYRVILLSGETVS